MSAIQTRVAIKFYGAYVLKSSTKIKERYVVRYTNLKCFKVFINNNKVYTSDNLLKETDIYLSYDNLVNNLTLTENAENITTALTVYGDGDLSIRTVNPLGTATIYDFSYYANEEWLSADLIPKVVAWQDKVDKAQEPYAKALLKLKELNKQLIVLKNEEENIKAEIKSLEHQQSLCVVAGNSTGSSEYASQIAQKQIEDNAKLQEIKNKETEIETQNNLLKATNQALSFDTNFTVEERQQLSGIIFQSSVQNTNFSVTDLKEYDFEEETKVMQELYDFGRNKLKKFSQPTYEFTVDVIDFLNLIEYKEFAREIELGKKITLEVNKERDLFAQAILLGMTLNLDDMDSGLSLTFANLLDFSSQTYTYTDLFSETQGISKQLDFESPTFAKAKQTHNAFNEYVNKAFDLSKQQLMAGIGNQEFVINENGIRGKSYNADRDEYDKEEIWINKNTIAFSDDNFNTVKTALGKVTMPDGNTSYGLLAEVIIGKLLCGSELVIENENNTFRVDGNGVYIKDAQIVMSSDTGSGQTLQDLLNGVDTKIDTALTTNETKLQDILSNVDSKIESSNASLEATLQEGLQDRIKGVVAEHTDEKLGDIEYRLNDISTSVDSQTSSINSAVTTSNKALAQVVDTDKKLSDLHNQFNNLDTGKYDNVLTSDGLLNTDKLKGNILAGKNNIICQQGDSKILVVNDTGIMIANSKTNGNWNFRTAISADGITADYISANATISADKIMSGTLRSCDVITKDYTDWNKRVRYITSLNHSGVNIQTTFIKNNNQLGFTQSGFFKQSEWQLVRVDPNTRLPDGDMGVSGSKSAGCKLSVTSKDSDYVYDLTGADGDWRWWVGGNTIVIDNGNISIWGNLDVTGYKNALVPTQHYGDRLLYCEESDRIYFNTKGIATTINGECTIELDPIFMETIELNSTRPYIIQLTSYSNAKVWIDKVEDDKFIVKSDKDTNFTYVLSAIRIGYENTYLEQRASALPRKAKEEIQERIVAEQLKSEVVSYDKRTISTDTGNS